MNLQFKRVVLSVFIYSALIIAVTSNAWAKGSKDKQPSATGAHRQSSVLKVQSGTPSPDPLPSWNRGGNKQAILDFVTSVTASASANYVKPGDRIAVFDNDGTLWAEQPMYSQLAFALARVKIMAPQHPEWNDKEPFASILAGDLKTALAGGEKAAVEIVMTTHSGMTTDEFNQAVKDWLAVARHPRTNTPYTEMVYQPMLELINYLKSNGFKVFIVSGGGVEFMRVWTQQVYGIPPEQVVGSSGKLKYEVRGGKPILVKLPEVDFVDDKEGKPVGIEKQIGKRPIAAFGNSDGDFQMLEWTTSGPGPGFGLIVHHDDAVREWAYDRDSHIGQLVRGLDEAPKRGWTVASMKNDWNKIFP
jgi:phosphoglycolate phosphatase-like HAD superfamily hydrolase